MTRPKDIAAGDWDTAFALLRASGALPVCDDWKKHLRKHDTLREALLSCSKQSNEDVHPFGGRFFLRNLGAPVATSRGGSTSRLPFTDAEIDAIVEYLRARFLEAP